MPRRQLVVSMKGPPGQPPRGSTRIAATATAALTTPPTTAPTLPPTLRASADLAPVLHDAPCPWCSGAHSRQAKAIPSTSGVLASVGLNEQSVMLVSASHDPEQTDGYGFGA